MKKAVIALDLGTTGNRAIAFDKNAGIIASSYYEFPQIHPKPAWVEQNPDDILNSAVKALKETIEKCDSHEITSMGITNQRETVILWNKRTGKPVYNAIVWQCRRTAKACEDLSEYRALIKEKTGLFLDPYFSATKIKWIIDNVNDAKSLAEKGELAFGTVDSWILWNLTGGKVHATDASNASRTLLYNINTLKYDGELLEIFNIPGSILPEAHDSNHNFGCTVKSAAGKSIPVIGILGDQQASLFAHGGFETGIIKNTYGTGLFAMVETGNKIYNSDKLVATVAWKIDSLPYYALEGSIFTGGGIMRYLKDNLNFINSAGESSDAAKSLDSNGGVYFVPALSGLGAPYWDPDARGLIIGLTGAATKNHIVRAALESLAYQTKDVILEFKNALKKDLNLPAYKLRVDGKASENEFLMQFQSDILNMVVEKTVFTEMTAFGIAGLSAITTGFWTIDEFYNLKKIEHVYNPKMDDKYRNDYYDRWKKAVLKSLKWA
ncbi:MAG: glycerol kinase GlpK [Deltaproteobacteria bacterium]|jgi:glycerol kinase|nr:glycerol kinase GlpK [Deltaproteobacteria bacterium]MCL5880765.1 glycerol kinase GlpK [Deltaproteobacteria bacterium]MDA8304231.1 glycerol kinase GlpK [Deltaproteobacteria bacterium]